MNNTLLVITISAYIFSIAACLILSIALRYVPIIKLKLPLLIHAMLMLLFCVLYMINQESTLLHYLSLAFVCSGLIMAGMVLRSDALLPFKVYFSLYLFTIVIFIVSPSQLFKYISYSWKSNDLYKTFHIKGNYFLEEQQGMLNLADDQIKYKVIQSFGIFHKTLARDIDFGHRLDSIRIISFNHLNALILRGYFSAKANNVNSPDSLQITTYLGAHTKQIIHKTSTSE